MPNGRAHPTRDGSTNVWVGNVCEDDAPFCDHGSLRTKLGDSTHVVVLLNETSVVALPRLDTVHDDAPRT